MRDEMDEIKLTYSKKNTNTIFYKEKLQLLFDIRFTAMCAKGER